MAVRAHQATGVVHAAVPIGALPAFMAGETDGIVLCCRARLVFRPERNDPADTAPAASLHMCRTGAVTIFAVKFAFLRLSDAAHNCVAKRFGLARMARRANLCADKRGFDGRGRLRSSCDRTIALC